MLVNLYFGGYYIRKFLRLSLKYKSTLLIWNLASMLESIVYIIGGSSVVSGRWGDWINSNWKQSAHMIFEALNKKYG